MAFYMNCKCPICKEEKLMDANRSQTICNDCQEELKEEERREWLNERKMSEYNERTLKERIEFLEKFIYDNFISKSFSRDPAQVRFK